MGLLVGTMDIATANNTVAIVMANPIAKEMAENYGITPRKTASLLDTFHVYSRELYHMVHRCLLQYRQYRSLDTVYRHFRYCQSFLSDDAYVKFNNLDIFNS